ncbi:MAG: molybdopterin converting factor subunit 1 [Proteobacteria bacterium]|nr:molybdopterin converting factor subunit 1 [Pseudomonadota bacterium]
MKILYFAWLKEHIGMDEENVAQPETVNNVETLIDWLITRGPGYMAAFENRKVVRAAVNQDFAEPDHPVTDGDEVAFFPPITGG